MHVRALLDRCLAAGKMVSTLDYAVHTAAGVYATAAVRASAGTAHGRP
jgi:hypothetical protein